MVSLRCFDISWMISLFSKEKRVMALRWRYIGNKMFSHFPSSSPSTRDDFNIKVLQAFVELHEFADLNLVQALR